MNKNVWSFFPNVNRYEGDCLACGEHVGAKEGFIHKPRNGRWTTSCRPCWRAACDLTPWVHYSGEHVVEAPSVARAGNRHKVFECNRCHGPVAFVKGSKGWYVAECFKSRSENAHAEVFRVYDHVVHTEANCEAKVKRDAEHRAHIDALNGEDARLARNAEVLATIPDDLPLAERAARVEALLAEGLLTSS